MKLNILKNSSFKVIFSGVENIDLKPLEFNIIECNLPGLSVGVNELNFNNIKLNTPGDSLVFNDLTLTVLCDSNLDIFKEILNYTYKIKNPETGDIEPRKYLFTTKLIILSNKGNYNKEIIFYNSWIKNIGDIQFTTQNNEDSVISFTIDLSYSFYVIQ